MSQGKIGVRAPEAVRYFGGGKGIRTPDLFHAMEALSQLSYTPKILIGRSMIKPQIISKNQPSNLGPMDTSATKVPTANTPIGRQFAEDGYYLAKGVFSKTEIEALEADFDRIVNQLLSSGENVNARWSGPEMSQMQAQNLVVLHTHNV